MVKTLRMIGMILTFLGLALISIGYASILYNKGFFALRDIMSPFNLWNWIAVLITLAPGIFFLQWSEKIKEKKLREYFSKATDESESK
jgi:hypothetical protein